jgi:YD repeat-containing protein
MARTSPLRNIICLAILIVSLVLNTESLRADTAQYYYDELGRLIGVVDGQNNAAVYQYDAVGNLLKIDRFTTTGGNVGIFLIAPGSSIVNKNVEIRGFGFTSPPSSNQVQFNGTTATVVSATATSIIVTIPVGATSGPVMVTNANGTAISPQAFTVLVPPIITGLEPSQLGQGVTTRGAIEGFNLNAASAVQFTQAGLTATILAGATDHTLPISITVAPSVPLGTYPFSVTTPSGTAQSGAITIEVRPAHPAFMVTGVLTVKMPLTTTVSATSAPIGPSSSTSAAATVQMPLDTTVPATSAPTGASTSVSPVNSIEMP